jgi:hypothetical protein
MATPTKRPSRSWPNFHNGDDLRKKKEDTKRDGLSPSYGETREAPANKKPSAKKHTALKKASMKKSK